MVRAAFAFLFTAAVLGVSATALAQTDPVATVQQRAAHPDQLFNWYYASVFGTGYYRIGEEQVGVLRVPLRYELRPASTERWGIHLTLPVTVAFAEFDLDDFNLGKVRAQGLTVLPGIEAEILLQDNWTVRPFVNVGGGWEFETNNPSTIFSLGATTRHTRPAFEASRLALGGKLAYAGYSAGSEASQLAQLSLGGELAVPAGFTIAERAALVAFQLIGTAYVKELEFLLPSTG
ncbi:MAG TPA: hypothetical protein VF262_00735, partial [Burkholderiales bacterium]